MFNLSYFYSQNWFVDTSKPREDVISRLRAKVDPPIDFHNKFSWGNQLPATWIPLIKLLSNDNVRENQCVDSQSYIGKICHVQIRNQKTKNSTRGEFDWILSMLFFFVFWQCLNRRAWKLHLHLFSDCGGSDVTKGRGLKIVRVWRVVWFRDPYFKNEKKIKK